MTAGMRSVAIAALSTQVGQVQDRQRNGPLVKRAFKGELYITHKTMKHKSEFLCYKILVSGNFMKFPDSYKKIRDH